MMKRFAVLTQAVVERMKRLPPSSLNEMDLSISAQDQIRLRKAEEWEHTLAEFLDNPQASANHLVMGYDLDQRRECMGLDDYNDHYNWR